MNFESIDKLTQVYHNFAHLETSPWGNTDEFLTEFIVAGVVVGRVPLA